MTSPQTKRTMSATVAGPVEFGLTMPYGQVSVTVADVDCAEITLISDASADSAAGRAISAATLSTDGRVVAVNVPTTGQDGITIIGDHGRVVISGNVNSGIIVSGGTMHISGSVISGQGVSAVNITPPVEAYVRLPRGSALRVHTKAGQVTTNGELESIDFTSVSGDLDADACARLIASSVSGDVRAEFADGVSVRTVSGDIGMGRTETAVLASTSGDIHIGDFGGSARLTTVSGDITVHATEPGRVTASSTSGDITVTAPAELAASTGENALTVDARSISGDVRTPRPSSAPTRPRRARRGGPHL